MKFKMILLLFLPLLFLNGCYDTKQDKNGRIIKVNKFTGEILVIDGDRVIKLKSEDEVKAEQEEAKKLEEPKNWPSQRLTIAGGTLASLTTKWSDGNLYYKFSVDKNLRNYGNYLSKLTIQLQDNQAFLINSIEIPLSTMTGLVGFDGKNIMSMECDGQLPMPKETYRNLKDWNVVWAGFTEKPLDEWQDYKPQ